MIGLIFLCLGTAALSCFLELCMEEGMIFNPYYRMVERLPLWLFKPLGGCIYCFNTWAYMIIFSVSKRKSPLNPELVVLFLFGLGFTFLFVKLLEKLR